MTRFSNAHNVGPAGKRQPGTYSGPLGRYLASRVETLTVPASELQRGDRLVEFKGYLSVLRVDPYEEGRVEVWFDNETSFDLRADFGVEVTRAKR